MKINEVEERLQISKANIRFYEKEGLLSPKRSENGYRDYSDEDVEVLKKIIILRRMGMTIPDIRGVLSGELELSAALSGTITHLEEQLAQLNGSLQLAKTMTADGVTDAGFDTERYWRLMNEEVAHGSKFVEIVSDYVEFEKRSLAVMWESVFFLPLSDIASEKSWRYAILLIFGICLVRGFMKAVVFRTGSFIEGFGYPILIFSIISLVTLPLYIMDYRYKDVPLPPPKQEGIGKSLLKAFVCLIVFLVGLFGGIGVVHLLIIPRIIAEQYYVLSTWLWPVYFLLSFYMLCVLLWLYGNYGVLGDLFKGEYGLRSRLPRAQKRRVLVCSVGVYLLGLICYCTCYDCFTFDGVERRVLWHTKSYTWEDVDHYTLQSGTDGILEYVVVMKDGMRGKCMGNTIGDDNLPGDGDPDRYDVFVMELDDYCLELTERFVRMGIPLEDTDFDKLYKKINTDSGKDSLTKLREAAEGGR